MSLLPVPRSTRQLRRQQRSLVSGGARKLPHQRPGPVLRWVGALAAICAATTLLVLLGMPVAGAVTSVSSLALLASQVAGGGTGPTPPALKGKPDEDTAA